MSVVCFPPLESPQPPTWAFAWQIYAQAGVAKHLLTRQERDQIWINDWLFALWQAHKGNTVIRDFRREIQPWQRWRDRVIVPWRCYRASLKAASTQSPGALVSYQKAKQAELSLEWHDQRYLWRQRAILTCNHEAAALGVAERLALSLQRLSEAPIDRLSDSVSVLLVAVDACGADSEG